MNAPVSYTDRYPSQNIADACQTGVNRAMAPVREEFGPELTLHALQNFSRSLEQELGTQYPAGGSSSGDRPRPGRTVVHSPLPPLLPYLEASRHQSSNPPHDESGYHYPPMQWDTPRPHGQRADYRGHEARDRQDAPGSSSHYDSFNMSDLYVFDASEAAAGNSSAEQHYDAYDYGR